MKSSPKNKDNFFFKSNLLLESFYLFYNFHELNKLPYYFFFQINKLFCCNEVFPINFLYLPNFPNPFLEIPIKLSPNF